MPGIIKVKIESMRARKLLHKMEKKGKSAKPLMTLFYVKVHQQVMLNFRLQSATANIFTGPPSNSRKPWKPLSSYTRSMRPGTNRLEDTGLMKGSMGKVKKIRNRVMVYGTWNSVSHVHQFGATIRPKKAKYLTLPASKDVTRRAREYDNTFFHANKETGSLTLMQAQDDGTAKPLFYLKKEIKIPKTVHITIPKKTLDNMTKMTWTYLEKGVK